MSALSKTSVVSEASVWTCLVLINVNVTAALGANHTAIQPVKVQRHWLRHYRYQCTAFPRTKHSLCVCHYDRLASVLCVCVCDMGMWNLFSSIPDINECLNPDTCPNEQCENTPGSYECVPCLPGHEAHVGTCYGECKPAIQQNSSLTNLFLKLAFLSCGEHKFKKKLTCSFSHSHLCYLTGKHRSQWAVIHLHCKHRAG